ncbi:MAG: alpha/beta hydrolase [Kineosporiaceae bacterium]
MSRRRGFRWLRRVVALVALLALAAAAGICWYFSGAAVAVDHSPYHPQMVQRVLDGRVQLSRDPWSVVPGSYGLAWEGGYGTVGEPARTTATSVVRPYAAVRGTPPVGTSVWVDPFAYDGDPRTALGLDFQEVAVRSDVGDLPTWYVPGAAGEKTWVVFVHGRGGTREESLRYLRMWHSLGLPVVVPMYRNDVGAPPSPDGVYHLGETEWRDASAAVQWALAHGADDVVLAGWSMGGAIALQVLDRAAVAPAVRGVVLDSPVLDWRDTFARQGSDRGLPRPLTALAVRVVEQRYDIDLDRYDWPARAQDLKAPVLLFHSDEDSFVPDGPSRALARARPDLVTFVDVDGAEHTRGWNVDPTAYSAAMTRWLTATGSVPAREAAG